MNRHAALSPHEAFARRPSVATRPLTHAQQRLWLLDQLESRGGVDNGTCAFRLVGTLDEPALAWSLGEVVRRHEALRSTLRTIDGVLVQSVEPPSEVPLAVTDVRALPDAERDARVRTLLAEEAARPFDLFAGPLFRTLLVRVGADEHVFLLTLHTIVAGDPLSIANLIDELGTLYSARVDGRDASLPELPIQYGDVAAALRREEAAGELDPDLAFWRDALAAAPQLLDLPTDRPRPAAQSHAGALASITLASDVTAAVRRDVEGDPLERAAPFLAAFATLLYRYTGQEDLVVGTPALPRRSEATERLVGHFGNVLAIRMRLDGAMPGGDVRMRAGSLLRAANAHAGVHFSRVLEELKLSRDLARTPLFQVTFDYACAPPPVPALAGLAVEPLRVFGGGAAFDLALRVNDADDGARVEIEYCTDLFEPGTIHRMLEHYAVLVAAIVRDPECPVARLPLLGADERERLLDAWNRTTADFPDDRTVADLVTAQASRTPHAIAVTSGDERLTYEELDARATRLARHLRATGVTSGTPVAVAVQRSPSMIVGLLAIWKAGGAYVPLDPEFPRARLELMLEDCGAPVLVTERAVVDRLPAHRGATVFLDDAGADVLPPPAEQPSTEAPADAADALAYVIYTSGSTGRPKGVEVRHRGVVNFLCAFRRLLGTTDRDVVIALTTLSFDIAGLELWLPLTVGATVVTVGRDVATDGRRLAAEIERVGATLVQATPATWRLLLESGWRGRRGLTALCGGEALPASLAGELLSHCERLWNVYGPTETTIWSTAYPVTRESLSRDGNVVPIGRPIANTSLYVLDRAGEPVPVGIPGELYIGGVGVARGYRNRPELTAERFVCDPFDRSARGRLYRTGDQARWREDSVLEFLGRLDGQVKLRGYRIELGEIESVLGAQPGVAEAAVVLDVPATSEPRLVGYFVPRSTPAAVELRSALRAALRAALPEYMVPSLLVACERLPRTPNGKLDRRALPAPDTTPEAGTAEAPRDEIEQQVARLFAEVLGVAHVGPSDNFFDLGGHSILATRLVARVAASFRRTVPLGVLFQAPTVARLADVLRNGALESRWSSLVPIKPGRDRPPFFCVHAVGGHVMNVRGLLMRLPPEQPVYALQARGMNGDVAPAHTFEEMAAHYLEEMRSVQPEGPYFIGGLSLGGVIAFEMARQLEAAGETPALVALLDTHLHPRLLPRMLRIPYRTLKLWRYTRLVLSGSMSETRSHLYGAAGSMLRRTRTRWAARRGELEALRDGVASLDEVQGLIRLAFERYVPKPYGGRLTLLRAADRHPDIPSDPAYEWPSWALDGVDVYNVPGDHLSMFEPPHVELLAARLAQCCDEALRRHTR